MNTRRRIERAVEFLDSIPYINSGGCGIAALAIARYVHKENPRIKLKFGFLGDYGTNEDGSRDAPSHVVLLWDGHRVDSNGIDSAFSQHWELIESLDESDLVASLNNVSTWNSAFDRAGELPGIERELDIDLSDVKHENPPWGRPW